MNFSTLSKSNQDKLVELVKGVITELVRDGIQVDDIKPLLMSCELNAMTGDDKDKMASNLTSVGLTLLFGEEKMRKYVTVVDPTGTVEALKDLIDIDAIRRDTPVESKSSLTKADIENELLDDMAGIVSEFLLHYKDVDEKELEEELDKAYLSGINLAKMSVDADPFTKKIAMPRLKRINCKLIAIRSILNRNMSELELKVMSRTSVG